MLLHLGDKKRRQWWVIPLCAAALILAMTCTLLFIPLSVQIGQADIINEDDYLTVAVPAFASTTASNGYNFGRILQNGGAKQLSSVKQVDHRTVVYVYSRALKPVTVWEHAHEDELAFSFVMPSSFFVGTIVCGAHEQTVEQFNSRLVVYRNQYEARMVQPITLCEDYADIQNMTVFVEHYEAELMEPGKTYLVWGMLVVDENHRAERHMKDHTLPLPVGVYHEEKNGSHWKMQEYPDDFVFLWISEIRGFLDEFLSSELGRQWQEDILARGRSPFTPYV